MSDCGRPQRVGIEADGLVGRYEELELIDSFLKESAVDGRALLVTGEPGVGKTALLDHTAQTALDAGTRVVRSVGAEFESDVAYAGLHQIILPLVGELTPSEFRQHKVLSVVLGLDDGLAPDRAEVFEATLALLSRASAGRALLVIVDDAHALDQASTEVLGSLSRHVAGIPVGLLAAMRPTTDHGLGYAGMPRHEVRTLGAEAATDLLRSRFPALPPRVCARLVTEAEGNALALLELGSEASGLDFGRGSAAAVVAPARSLRLLFASRVRELPATTRQLLLRAALEGTGDPRIVCIARPGDPDPRALASAEQAGLIRMDPSSHRIVFTHPLIRSVVVKQSTSCERRAGHQALARLLADQPERRAWHLAEATIAPDDRVAVLLDEVARRSMRRGDAVRAVAALRRSAELSPRGADRSRRLAQAAYLGASVTGELHDAPRLLTAAYEADPGHEESLHTAVAAAFMLLTRDGDVDAAYQLLSGAIDAFEVRDVADERVLNEALGTLLLVCCFGARPALWDYFRKAVVRATPEGLLSLCGTTYCDPVHTEGADLERLDGLIAKSDGEVDPTWIVRLATAGVFVDRVPGLRAALWRVVHDARQGGAIVSGINGLLLLGLDDFMTGKWDEAEALLEEGLQRCESHGYGLFALPGRFVQALLAAGRGEFDAAASLIDDVSRWAAPRGVRLAQMYAHRVRTLAALGRGDFEDAYRQASAICPAGVLAPCAPFAVHALMDLVEAAVRTNRLDEANAHVAAMGEAGVAALSPRLALLAKGAAAIAAPGDAAASLFEEALAVPGAELWAFDLARVRLAYGEHLRRFRAVAASRAQLDAALEAFEGMGARPWATRARNELQATAETRSRANSAGPAALTPREREIAQLAASGLSNKQIGEQLQLSARTVGAHLRHIFQKLGVASRVALRDALGPVTAERDDE